MFTIDGKWIQTIDHVSSDCKIILVTEKYDNFKGISGFKFDLDDKGKRSEYASQVKKRVININKNFTNR